MPKHFYWLKLMNTFFESDDVKVVLSQDNGPEYLIFRLKLLLKAISREDVGRLMYRESVPYTTELLSTVTGTNVDIVRGALTLFGKIRMIEILDDGTHSI